MYETLTTQEAACCLRILQEQSEPIVAVDLADKLGLAGSHETKRRRIRAIIKLLRDKGSMIVAVGMSGYFLTEDTGVWKDYQEQRQITAKRILGETHRRKKMIANSKGQGMLFKAPKICGGIG